MIVYFDTSAIVPLLVEEPASTASRRMWNDADEVVTCRISYAEAAAALAQAERLRRLTRGQHEAAVERLHSVWQQASVVEIDQPLVEAAADLARRFGLRGYDSVQCAAAHLVADDETVAAAGDQALLAAWDALGITTYKLRP